MMRLLFTIAILAVFAMPFIGASAETSAQIQAKIDATKQERDALLEEQKRLEAALAEISKESATLSGSVKSLDATRSKLAADLKLTQNNLKASDLTIRKLEGEIDANESAILDHRAAIKDSLRRLRLYDANDGFLSILSGDGLSSIWSDALNVIEVEERLADEVTHLENAQKELADDKSSRQAEQKRLLGLSTALVGQQKVIEETRDAKEKLLKETQNKEAEYQRMLAENKARAEEFDKQLSDFESDLKASDQSLIPSAKKGVLDWPLEKVFVTQYFGYTAAARRLYSSSHHNGVDFRASVGTPVMAVRAGVVVGAGNTDEERGCYSYGRWLLIEHDNGLSSLYAHLSASLVTTGQKVEQGEIIGYSGGQPGAYGSGASTGPHLHFGLYATAGVHIDRYVTSNHCKNVSIPLANPQDYLDPLAYLPALY